MGSSISNETKADKYKIINSTINNQKQSNISNQKQSNNDSNQSLSDFDSIELKQYNYTDENHQPPFPNEYYSEFVIPKEYICEKTNKPFYIFMSEIIGNNGKNLIDITESYNMCYIWHDKVKDTIQIWGNKDKHKIIHDYINNMICSKLNYEKFYSNKYKTFRNLNKIVLQTNKKQVFNLFKKNFKHLNQLPNPFNLS
tara:strand:- start:3386 stop:3979 length:594 start_codon:yes stop_codon:yes gene_type:complete